MDIGIGCGVEMMSVCKMGSSTGTAMRQKEFTDNFPFKLIHQVRSLDSLVAVLLWFRNQGLSAEKVAETYKITKKDCDDFATESHRKAGIARALSHPEVVAIQARQKDGALKLITDDEGIRYPPNREGLNKLRTVFKDNGVVTAGNASQVLYSVQIQVTRVPNCCAWLRSRMELLLSFWLPLMLLGSMG